MSQTFLSLSLSVQEVRKLQRETAFVLLFVVISMCMHRTKHELCKVIPLFQVYHHVQVSQTFHLLPVQHVKKCDTRETSSPNFT